MTNFTKRSALAMLALGTSLGGINAAYAHHSAAPHFDQTIDITKTGIVTEWNFVNPHSYVHFDVTNADGSVDNWRCEHGAATQLRRQNYTKDTLAPGMEVTVYGAPARREENVCLVLEIEFGEGDKVARAGELSEDQIRGDVFVEGSLSTEHMAFLDDGVTPNFAGYWIAQRGGPPAGGGDGGMGGPPDGAAMGGGMGDAMGGDAMGGGAMGGGGMGGGGMGGASEPFPYTAAGQAAADKYEQIYDDPTIKCGISSIFFGMTHDQNVNYIKQYDDRISFLYGFMDYERTIWLDDRDFPENIEPTEGGYSIGQFEGDTLVVTTKGFTPGVLQPLAGTVYSDQMESIERFRYNSETSRLERSYVASDPVYFAQDYTGNDDLAKSATPYTPYNCVELSGLNNLRPGSPEYLAEEARMKAEGVVSGASAGIQNAASGAVDAAASTGLPKWLLALGGIAVLLGGFMALRGKKS